MQDNIRFSKQTNLLVLEQTENSSSSNSNSLSSTTNEQSVIITVTEQLPLKSLTPSSKATSKRHFGFFC